MGVEPGGLRVTPWSFVMSRVAHRPWGINGSTLAINPTWTAS